MRWKPVPGHQGVEALADGRVRFEGRTLVPRECDRSDSGYQRVRLPSGKKLRVHRAVLLAHRGPPPEAHWHGAHLNGDRDDNRLANLEWKPPVANEADKRAHGTAPRGGANKRPSPQVLGRIRSALSRGDSYGKIARRHGLHRHTVSRYARGLRRQ